MFSGAVARPGFPVGRAEACRDLRVECAYVAKHAGGTTGEDALLGCGGARGGSRHGADTPGGGSRTAGGGPRSPVHSPTCAPGAPRHLAHQGRRSCNSVCPFCVSMDPGTGGSKGLERLLREQIDDLLLQALRYP
ncbi:uncharacterized protein LOC126416951 [Schistocerca serialis cubense]|uniref:uncharacterized protein LOC126416951 n=1 Tax=Schistocerca serialis cubense TaxID=2023355 RepID=UPI00214F178F|nr:uncharacterized protein LOC126416951 [Schistocerca serialis cubense]